LKDQFILWGAMFPNKKNQQKVQKQKNDFKTLDQGKFPFFFFFELCCLIVQNIFP